MFIISRSTCSIWMLSAFLVTVLAAGPPASAGGRRCLCEEHLQKLSSAQVPQELRLSGAMPEVVAAFDIGDRGVAALDFAGSGETLVVAEAGPERRGEGAAGRVLLFDLTGTAPRLAGELEATADYVASLGVSPLTGRWLATGSVRWDQQLKLFAKEEQGFRLVQTQSAFSEFWLRSLAFSPNEHSLATVSRDSTGSVQLWDLSGDGLKPGKVLPSPAGAASAIAYSLDGKFLAGGIGSGHRQPSDGQLFIWDVSGPNPRIAFLIPSLSDKPADVTAIVWLQGSSDTADRTLVAANQDGRIEFAHVTDAGRVDRIGGASERGGVRSMRGVDGQRFVTSADDGTVALWSARGERQTEWKFGHGPAVLAVAPSGVHVAIGLGNGTVYVVKLSVQ